MELSALEPPTRSLVLGIDAANLRRGGGVTHLAQLLEVADPVIHGFNRVIVWGGKPTLARLPDRPWLLKINPAALDSNLLCRTLWQRRQLSHAARTAGCNVLFVPGGHYSGSFRPIVTMSQNLLPFDWRAIRRYGLTPFALKLLLLRRAQSATFRKADGLIFLTEYAKQAVSAVAGPFAGRTTIISHGIDGRFLMEPRPQRLISDYTPDNPCRLLYVSIIDLYKHQTAVVEAVHLLRGEGLPLELTLVGPAYAPALRRLEAEVNRLDPQRFWVRYRGAVPYEELHALYAEADFGFRFEL